jgi:transcriptional regulator with XRE-family HTH domain
LQSSGVIVANPAARSCGGGFRFSGILSPNCATRDAANKKGRQIVLEILKVMGTFLPVRASKWVRRSVQVGMVPVGSKDTCAMTNPSANASPFRLLLGRLLMERARAVGIPSGRALAHVLGRSAGTVSQMLAGTLVPSGDAVLEIAEALRLSADTRDALLRAAIESKVEAKARDGFWLSTALGWERDARSEVDRLKSFLAERGLSDAYADWVADAEQRSPVGRRSRDERALWGDGLGGDPAAWMPA